MSTKTGKIGLIFGPMFSGKSTELIRRIRRFRYASKSTIVFKYEKDKRYENTKDEERQIITHDKETFNATPCMKLYDVINTAKNYEVIGIDEGQFFSDIVEFSEELANLGKIVIIAALDGDFRRKPFGRVLELVPLSEDIQKLKGICKKCKSEDGAFTQRTVESKELELIGGDESYVASCRKCHY